MNDPRSTASTLATTRSLHARINAQQAQRFGVVAGHERFWVEAAFSCLVQPRVGDTVLVSLDGAGVGYILAVLARAEPSLELQLGADVQLRVTQGSLTVQCRDSFSLAAGEDLVVRAEHCSLNSPVAELLLGQLRVSGERVSSHWQEREERTLLLDQQAVRHEAHYGESRQCVTGHEQRRSGSLHQRVDEDCRLNAQRLTLEAEGRVAIDGSTIELG